MRLVAWCAMGCEAVQAQATQGVTVREGGPDDLALVLDSWRESYRRSSGDVAHAAEKRFRDGWGALATMVAGRARVLCAVLEDSPEVVCGWVLWEPPAGEWPALVHYVYVKSGFRMAGIARALLESAVPGWPRARMAYTHRTPALHAYRRKRRDLEWEYDPWAAWGA